MMVKIVSLFLIVMLVMAMFGRLRVPYRDKLAARKCKRCGRYRIGKSDCPCQKRQG